MFVTSPMSSRNQFGRMLNSMSLTDCAVEIGTHRGEFAKVLLDTWIGRVLNCVDPWEQYDQDVNLPNKGRTRTDDYTACQQLLAKHGSRVQLIKQTSVNYALCLADNSVDFAYIDGDHSYEAVLTDLHLWWGKVKPGGILAGHDVIMPGENNGGWGQFIQPAIDDFIKTLRSGRETMVYLIVEECGLPWSFYIIKP